jgi:hypothetical protein
MPQGRHDRFDPEMFSAVTSRSNAVRNRSTRLLDSPRSEAAAIDFHQPSRVERRSLADADYRRFAEFRQEDAAGPFGPIPSDRVTVGEMDLVGDEIAQRVNDRSAAIDFKPLQHVRMMPQNHRCPGIDNRVRLLDLQGRRNEKSLFAPMERNYDVVNLAAEVADLPGKAVNVERGDSPSPLGGKPEWPASLVDRRQEGQSQTACFHDRRRCGFGQVHAGPKMPDPMLIERASKLPEPAVETVKGMVVCQRKNVETRRCNPTDGLRIADHPRLGRNVPAVAGKRKLQVCEAHVALCESRTDCRRNQIEIAKIGAPGRISAEQQIAHGGKTNSVLGVVCHLPLIRELCRSDASRFRRSTLVYLSAQRLSAIIAASGCGASHTAPGDFA